MLPQHQPRDLLLALLVLPPQLRLQKPSQQRQVAHGQDRPVGMHRKDVSLEYARQSPGAEDQSSPRLPRLQQTRHAGVGPQRQQQRQRRREEGERRARPLHDRRPDADVINLRQRGQQHAPRAGERDGREHLPRRRAEVPPPEVADVSLVGRIGVLAPRLVGPYSGVARSGAHDGLRKGLVDRGLGPQARGAGGTELRQGVQVAPQFV
mmetsp:Transcript_33814/g.72078  ORF Transcript_33814/g.72078 Transcript_33814/m.72078 type:complete len:208 (-) Transcript_33814:279-902(-)